MKKIPAFISYVLFMFKNQFFFFFFYVAHPTFRAECGARISEGENEKYFAVCKSNLINNKNKRSSINDKRNDKLLMINRQQQQRVGEMKNSMSISTQLTFFISTLNRWVFFPLCVFRLLFFIHPRRWMEFIDVLLSSFFLLVIRTKKVLIYFIFVKWEWDFFLETFFKSDAIDNL